MPGRDKGVSIQTGLSSIANGPRRGSHWFSGSCGLRRKPVIRIAKQTNAAAMAKLEEKLPVLSASTPAMDGPVIWPMPKMNVMKPNAARALSGPTYSLTAATIMDGMDQATMP